METIVSIIISSIFAIIITWYFTRKQMKKNEITHFSINSYNVGKGLQNEFPNFQLTYEDQQLSNEVIVLKGGFVNTGRNDITGLKKDSDISIILPNDCRLKDIKTKPFNDSLDVSSCVDIKKPNIINFAIDDKFMSGEAFEYTAIIEMTTDIKNLHHKINFKHRIPNTSKIKNDYIGVQTQLDFVKGIEENLHETKIAFCLSLISFVVFSLISLFYFWGQNVRYIVVEKGTDKEYSLFITPQSQLYVSDNAIVPFFDKKILTKEELDTKYSIFIKTAYSWSSYDSISGFLMGFFAVIFLSLTFLSFYQWSSKKRIYKLLDITGTNNNIQ